MPKYDEAQINAAGLELLTQLRRSLRGPGVKAWMRGEGFDFSVSRQTLNIHIDLPGGEPESVPREESDVYSPIEHRVHAAILRKYPGLDIKVEPPIRRGVGDTKVVKAEESMSASDRLAALSSEMRTAIAPAEIQDGHRVRFRSRRKGWMNGTITQIRHKWRARKFPYAIKLVGVTVGGQPVRLTTNRYAEISWIEFLEDGTSGELPDLEDVQELQREREDARTKRKQDRADTGTEVLRRLNIEPGDVVNYGYRSRYGYGKEYKHEIVAEVNHQTGKIAIADTRRFREFRVREYTQAIKGAQKTTDLPPHMGRWVRERKQGYKLDRREKRWLPAQQIEDVVARAPDKPIWV